MEKSPSSEKSFVCQYCERVFRRREHVQRHERTHTKETPFRCPCGKAFTRGDLLRRHEKLVHNEGANFQDESQQAPNQTSGGALPSSDPISEVLNQPTNQSSRAFQVSLDQPLQSSSLSLNPPSETSQTLLNQTLDYWSQDVAMQLDDNSAVPTTTGNGIGSVDEQSFQFQNYDAFLDNADLSVLVPQDLDDELAAYFPHSVSPDLTDPYSVSPNISTTLSTHNAIAKPFSGVIDQLPSGRDAASLSSRPRRHQPCWKISTTRYRRILQRLRSLSEVLPKGFSLLSRHTLSRFVEGCVKGFCEHFPFLHLPTLSTDFANVELILAMAAIGAQFRFESHRKLMLFDAAKAVVVEKFRRREQNLTLDEEAGNDQTQTLQALLCLIAVGLWGPKHLLQEGMSLQNLVVRLVRETPSSSTQGLGQPVLKDLLPAEQMNSNSDHAQMSDQDRWQSWVQQETRKRTNFVAYSMLALISFAYHVPPALLTSEIHCSMPCSTKEWNAKSGHEWQTIQSRVTPNTNSFQQNFESLFQLTTSDLPNGLSPFASYTLIVAILQFIFFRRETLLSSRRQSINTADVEETSRALQCWQASWERSRQTDNEDRTTSSPVIYNATALLRLGWLRLHADLGPCRSLASRDPSIIASAFNNCPPIPRALGLIQPALQAVHALSVPVRMGINFVARTQTISWSVQLSLSNLECAIFLCKWLERLALTCKDKPLENQEMKLVLVIHGLLQETGLFDDEVAQSMTDIRELDKKLRHLATGVAKLWAEVFKGMHVFELVDTIGASLAIYAEMMERACSPESAD